MRPIVTLAAIAVIAAESLVAGQGKDANQVMADARKALGGDKLAAVKTLSAEGRTLRTGSDGNTRETEFEWSMELPDKYMMRSVLANMGNMSIYRMTGFNGGQPIEEIDRPPNLAGGGNIVIRMGGPLGSMEPDKITPEQKAEFDKMRLLQNKKEFTRMALGMFATSLSSYPLTFTYGGEAESADGKADVIDVKGEDDFAVRLFIDQQTHMPLMLSWMDKEPLVMTMGLGGPGAPMATSGGGAATTFTTTMGGGGVVHQRVESAPSGQPPSKEELEKRVKEMDERRKEAEAKRRTVEYRVFYADYQAVNGVLLPHKLQRSVDGKPTEETVFDTLKVNPKIDAKKFQVSK